MNFHVNENLENIRQFEAEVKKFNNDNHNYLGYISGKLLRERIWSDLHLRLERLLKEGYITKIPRFEIKEIEPDNYEIVILS